MNGPRVDADLVARLTPAALTAARRRLPDREDQLDAVQDGWLLLLASADTIRDPARVSRWLNTAVGRQAGRLARRRLREIPSEATADHWCPWVPSTENSWLLTDRDRTLWTLVSRLPPPERALVEPLAFEPGLSHRELAARLGISAATVARWRSRSLRRLREWSTAEGMRL
ncbi:RNA polymerase sigma factor (sigma-70 family) [Saccharomonospora amisosensis]|uniref:RNA polymerase sigma factor (Sigma-70 family) n=1 Tax=Saccharomonospora amisosensis TaxID=1128677 RepID=A0A7X5UUZ9_9PSEU|nr:sigma-70 family RNA polymerase sigma factor [Saccharomonospora amisosensis]NIJ14673.1 RNA polymerase sigma factor (sigma-70 family) [Saccharomonospora amisosensis]